jgi:Carboxypeptidase regulatory-like domain
VDLTRAGSLATAKPGFAPRAILIALAIVAASALLAPSSASAVGATESIKGKVTDASSGEPIEGAAACPYSVARETYEECAFTDAEGEYIIPSLLEGEYKVAFVADYEGLNYITQFYNGKPTFEEADKVHVEGSPVLDVNAEMEEGGEIAGTVTDASTNNPIEELEVCALEKEEFEFVACTYTNASGKYTLAGLPAGEYKVEFWAEGYEGPGYITQYYNDEPTYSQADPVAATVGSTTQGIDAHLVPIASLFPANIGAPQLLGTPSPGDTLFCSTGSWTNNPTSYSYGWLRNGTSIGGLTASTYLVQSTDLGASIACRVTAFNSYGSNRATSNAVQIAAAPVPPKPHKKHRRCRKGFKKRKVHGKVKCVKKRHRKKHRHKKHR